MAKRVGQNIKMTSVDELLRVPSSSGCEEIEVSKIHPFKNNTPVEAKKAENGAY